MYALGGVILITSSECLKSKSILSIEKLQTVIKKIDMQKNWYAIYTRPQCEKKVVALFTKWKIDNFCPMNCIRPDSSWKSKMICEPLFKSYVFVHIDEVEIKRVLKAEGVVSLLYWLGKPAIIRDAEIQVIKEFTTNYQDIKLEQTEVNLNDTLQITNGSSYSMAGNLITVKNETVRINLPSLGFILIAGMEKENLSKRRRPFLKNISLKNSETTYQ